MSWILKKLMTMNLQEFTNALDEGYVTTHDLEKYLKNLTHTDNWEVFAERIQVIKSINNEYVTLSNKYIWGNAIIKEDIKIDKLLELGFTPAQDSGLGAYIVNRKLYYNHLWETTDNMFDKVFNLILKYHSPQIIINDIEKAINDNYKAKCMIENHDIEWIERYYNKYQENPKDQYKCSLLILKNQIKYIEKLLPNESLVTTYPFEEVVLSHVNNLMENAPHLIKKIVNIESNNDAFSKYIISLDSYNKLQGKIPNIDKAVNNKFKV